MNTPAYIFDIDGTISDHSHRLPLIRPDREGGKDWKAFHAACVNDAPIEPVCDVVGALIEAGWPVLFITARMESQREVTTTFLRQLFGTPERSALYMRADGDKREDTIIKSEILDRILAEGVYRPVMAFEDRPRVCDMWRSRGLVVAKIGDMQEFQVSPPSESWAHVLPPVEFKPLPAGTPALEAIGRAPSDVLKGLEFEPIEMPGLDHLPDGFFDKV